MHCPDKESALTGLEIIIAIAFLCISIYIFGTVVFKAVMPDHDGGGRGGIVSFAAEESEDLLMVDGICYGAQDLGGALLGVELESENQHPTEMGGCTIPLKLFAGRTVSVDMNQAVIVFSYSGVTEELSYSEKRPLSKPSWTIADKSSKIPLGSADGDNLLEPNEVFTLLVYPDTPVPAYGQFSVSVTPKSELPLVVKPTVPPEIAKHRIVELFV